MCAAVRGLVLVSVWMLASYGSAVQAGMLFGFDVAVAGDHHYASGQIYGRSLVACNTDGNGGSVGVGLSRNPDNDTYTVGGNLDAGLNVEQGSVRVGGSVRKNLNWNGGGALKQLAGFDALDLIDPDSMRAAMRTASDYFTGLTLTNTYAVDRQTLTFTAVPGADGVAVFNVDIAHLNAQNVKLVLDRGTASSIVFNVTGKGPLNLLGNFDSSFEDHASAILWNVNTTHGGSAVINRQWYGSILMPTGSLSNDSAIIGGVYVGGDFNQNSAVRQVGYSGPPILHPSDAPGVGDIPVPEEAPNLASVPEPSTIMVFAVGGLIFAGHHWRKRRQQTAAVASNLPSLM